MLHRVAALIAAALVVGSAVPRAAHAAVGARPVNVQSCSLDRYRLSLDVTFTNASQKTVSNVQFAITTASNVLSMENDAGAFAPGDVVSHRLRVDQRYFELWADVSCAPSRVTFQDGSTWDNPAIPPSMEQALTQTPGSNIAFSRCFTAGDVHMDYRNTAQQNATEVDLGLVQHGLLVWTVNDKGSFSPDTLIQRAWLSNNASRGDRNQTIRGYAIDSDMLQERCIVLGVTYADGTSWKNPAVPPSALDGIPFTPPSPIPDAPLVVTNCDGSSSSSYGNGNWRVEYRNASSKPSVAADFALVMHGKLLATARDVHTLSPDGSTKAHFPLGDPKVFQPACIPIRMNFADGTEWINPLFSATATR